MKNRTIFFYPLIALVVVSSGCSKPLPANIIGPARRDAVEWTAQTTNGAFQPIVPIKPLHPILPPGQTEYCIPNQSEFYAYVWGFPYGPVAQCPYSSYAPRSVRVTFTDGSIIYCQPTIIQFGTTGQGGAALQDLSCTIPTGGFLTYILLSYYENMGGQSSAIDYILHSTVTTFSFPVFGLIMTKTIRLI